MAHLHNKPTMYDDAATQWFMRQSKAALADMLTEALRLENGRCDDEATAEEAAERWQQMVDARKKLAGGRGRRGAGQQGTDRFRFVAVQRAGQWAVVRILAGGAAAGYDPLADRAGEQRHYQIHYDRPGVCTAIDAAFADSRKYHSREYAVSEGAASGRVVEFV